MGDYTTKGDLEDKFGNKPIDTNTTGGRQSRLERRFDLIPPTVLQRLAHVLWYGAQRYGEDNWKGISRDDNLNHAVDHIYEFWAGDTSEDHIGHALTRLVFAVYVDEFGITEQGEQVGEPIESAPLFTFFDVRNALDVRNGLGRNTIDRVVELLEEHAQTQETLQEPASLYTRKEVERAITGALGGMHSQRQAIIDLLDHFGSGHGEPAVTDEVNPWSTGGSEG